VSKDDFDFAAHCEGYDGSPSVTPPPEPVKGFCPCGCHQLVAYLCIFENCEMKHPPYEPVGTGDED